MNAMTEPLLFKQVIAGQERELASFDTHPAQYRHWKLARRGRRRAPELDVDEDGGIKPGYSSSSTPTTSASTSSCTTRSSASASSTRRCKVVVIEQRQGADLLLGRQHLHARAVDPRLEGELLQVHQRDPQRHRGRHAPSRPASSSPPCNGTPPAAATSWRWPATRSCWSTTAPRTVSLPEVPLLGVLPGTGGLTRVIDKRKVRRDLRRRLLHHGRGREGRARRGLGAGRRARQAAAVRRSCVAARDRSAAPRSRPRRRRTGRRR